MAPASRGISLKNQVLLGHPVASNGLIYVPITSKYNSHFTKEPCGLGPHSSQIRNPTTRRFPVRVGAHDPIRPCWFEIFRSTPSTLKLIKTKNRFFDRRATWRTNFENRKISKILLDQLHVQSGFQEDRFIPVINGAGRCRKIAFLSFLAPL